MPPKAKVTKEMVIDAAFGVARETGWENINARTVAEELNCSTQPVMYHFATIEELKKAVYAKTDRYHTEYLMDIQKPQDGAMLGIGLNYIRFEERGRLFISCSPPLSFCLMMLFLYFNGFHAALFSILHNTSFWKSFYKSPP